jgi:hypothetical protein
MYRLRNIYDYFRYDLPRRIKNFLFWGWVLRDDRCWDSGNVYVYLTTKLNKLYEVMNTSRHIKYYPRLLKELKEMCELAKRLNDEDTFYYENQYFHPNHITNFLDEEWSLPYYHSQQQDEMRKRFFYLMNKNLESLWE